MKLPISVRYRFSFFSTSKQCKISEPEKQGGIGIPKNKNQASASSAKSLPMNIPVFSSALRNHVQEDSDDGLVSVFIFRLKMKRLFAIKLYLAKLDSSLNHNVAFFIGLNNLKLA